MLLAVFTQFSPSDQELCYLRILLLHIPGATTQYDELRMVDGIYSVQNL